jgi:uncharacterized RDD family membrane protein YckC
MSEPIGTQYGGFWIRFLALLADSAIVFLISAFLVTGAAMALSPDALGPVFLVVWLLAFLYWPVMHASAAQATFGKSLLGLKVARVNGGRISILRSFGRELSKIFSGAALMIGYLMAAFTPRKQGLHDLVASTYVMREGVSRVVPTLAVVVAGFALPVVVVPMLVGAAMVATMTNMAEGMLTQSDPMKQVAKAPAPKPAVVAKAAPKPPPSPAPAPTQTAQAPAPTPATVTAPKPEPVVVAKPLEAPKPAEAPKPPPVVVASPEPKPVVAPKPVPVAVVKPKPAPVAVARAPAPAPKPAAPAIETKVAPASGPKFNDLMTAVLYRDPEGVSELLRLGKWADKRDSRGVTPLMTAVELGDVRTAEVLLLGGANPHYAIPLAEGLGSGEMIVLLKRYSGR